MNNLEQMLNKKPVTATNPAPIAPVTNNIIPNVAAVQSAPVSNTPSVSQTPVSHSPNEEKQTKFFSKIPVTCDNYIRDYQYHVAITTGNLRFSLKDALCSIIEFHKANTPPVPPRPVHQ